MRCSVVTRPPGSHNVVLVTESGGAVQWSAEQSHSSSALQGHLACPGGGPGQVQSSQPNIDQNVQQIFTSLTLHTTQFITVGAQMF